MVPPAQSCTWFYQCCSHITHQMKSFIHKVCREIANDTTTLTGPCTRHLLLSGIISKTKFDLGLWLLSRLPPILTGLTISWSLSLQKSFALYGLVITLLALSTREYWFPSVELLSVEDDENKNLTLSQKLWFKLHCKLGHWRSFKWIQFLARKGWLGEKAQATLSKTIDYPIVQHVSWSSM